MKKALKVVLVILLVLVIAAGIVLYLHWDNIMALRLGLASSDTDIQQMIEDNQKAISEALKAYPQTNVRDLNEEEKNALAAGEITEEDAVELVLGNKELKRENGKAVVVDKPADAAQAEANGEGAQGGENAQQTTPDGTAAENPGASSQKTVDTQISELVAKMYVLKSGFSSQLQSLESSVKSEYLALPAGERNNVSKLRIASSAYDRALSLEAECDQKVEEVVSQLRTLLKDNQRDTSLADEIMRAYANEKQITKAYYVNLYQSEL